MADEAPKTRRSGFSNLTSSWTTGAESWIPSGGLFDVLRRQDRYIESVVENNSRQLNSIDEQRRKGDLQSTQDFLCSIFEHLQNVTDVLAIMVNRTISADTAISLKLLWPGEGEAPLVRTLVRDRDSAQTPARRRSPDNFAYHENTAFRKIVDSGGATSYFVSEDLLKLKLQGEYDNANDQWQALYNTTAVAAIPAYPYDGQSDLVGFLCADSKYGRMDQKQVRRILTLMARHFYSVFSLALSGFVELTEPTEAAWRRSTGPGGAREIGWGYSEGSLRLNEPSTRTRFEETILLMQELARQAAQRRRLGEAALKAHLAFGTEQTAAGPDDDWLGVEDEDFSPEFLTALNRPSTREHFVRTMERLAPTNPYAQHVLDAATRNKNQS